MSGSRFVVAAPFLGWLFFGRYASGDLAMLIRAGADESSEPIVKPTVFLESGPPNAGCVWIKTWAENAGVLETLELSGAVERTGRVREVGHHCEAFEARLTPAAALELERQRAAEEAFDLPDLEPASRSAVLFVPRDG